MLVGYSVVNKLIKSFVAFVPLFASVAFAKPLDFVESLQDDSPGLPNLLCTHAAIASPDDKFVYASSYCDGAINTFSRDSVTGKLTLLSSLVGNETTGEGLRNVKWLVMHPNGKYLFAHGITGLPASTTAPYHNAIYTYERDTTTGLLTFKSELNSPLIKDAWNMHISSDGNFLYVGRQDGIQVLQISSNGVLTPIQSVNKTSNLSKYSYTRSFIFSADSKYVYVDSGNNSISWLSRDITTGTLNYGGELLSPGMVASTGSLRVKSLGRSNDGKHLYAFIEPNDTNKTVLRHFSIASDGSLTFVNDTLSTPASAGGNFYCPGEILVSANDRLLYFVDGCADNFQVWLRDPVTGDISYIGAEAEDDGEDDVPELAFSQANNISFSNDGHFAIVAVDAGITTVKLTADVAITSDFQKSVSVKSLFTGKISLTNMGPADAHGIEITLTGNALAGLKSASLSSPQGVCNQQAEALVCKLPSLTNTAIETIDLTFQAPDSVNPLYLDVAKTQAEIDTDTSTDLLQIVIQPVVVSASSSQSSQSSAQSSAASSQSSSAQAPSSSPAQQAPTPPTKKGGGSIGWEWLVILSAWAMSNRRRH